MANLLKRLLQRHRGRQGCVRDISGDEVCKWVKVVLDGFPPDEEGFNCRHAGSTEWIQNHVTLARVALDISADHVGRTTREIRMNAVVSRFFLPCGWDRFNNRLNVCASHSRGKILP